MTDDSMRGLFEVFRTEVADALDELGQVAGQLGTERGPKLRTAAKAALRLAHNVKGAAGSVGLEELAALAHSLEEALSPCSQADEPPPREVTDPILRAVSLIERLVDVGHDCDHELAEQTRALGRELVEQARHYRAALGSWHPPGSVPSPAGQSASTAPTANDPAPPVHQESPEIATVLAGSHLRVPAGRLDELAGHVDELIILRGQVTGRARSLESAVARLAENIGSLGPAGKPCEGPLRELQALLRSQRETAQALVRRVSELGDCVRRVRTVPLAAVAPSWRRVVRDCALELGKNIKLEVNVGDTELDKQVLDRIRDPFLHLLRNAVDHGIEGSDERYVLGKPAQGTITVEARMMGGRVVLEVRDDGQGIDPDEIAKAAQRKGLLSAAQVQRLRPADKLELLFLDGFSTASAISSISGRGVGLSAVRDAVRQLAGDCTVESAGYGEGTTIRVSVPMSIMALRGLLVQADGVTYILPTDIVERAVKVKREEIRVADGQDVVPITGSEPVAVRWLSESLRSRRGKDADAVSVVSVTIGNHRAGLVVEEVLDEHECVVKHLPWNLRHVRGINGAVVLPDGSAALSLDPQALLETPGNAALGPRLAAKPEGGEARRPRILVVDDSLTSRTLERNILASAGYDVDVAVDGSEAWSLLGERAYDLLVADVQMPQIDGFELTRRVRADTRLRALPVILVTALASPEDIAQGALAGADEYLVKAQLEHDKLVEAVSRYLLAGAS